MLKQQWESSFDDTKLEQVIEKLHVVEADFTQLNNEVKKLQKIENMAKDVDMKKLHQQVSRLCIQQQKIIDYVIELQAEEEKVTCIIQLVYENV